ncbi:MAG: S9 family peptidase, partial [Myxococcales bacterium]|nr:S9 family peptidase [Myxococcales bacterium]
MSYTPASFVLRSCLSWLPLLALSLATCDDGATICPDTPAPDDKAEETPAEEKSPWVYPAARVSPQVDEIHQVGVADPYRWLEDIDSEETRAWVEAENALTFGYLETIAARKPIAERLEQLWNFERYGSPWTEGGRWFYSKNDGLQNQAVYYWTDDLAAEPKLLLDPNTLSADGTTAVSGVKISHDGKLMAYALSDAGSDWKRWLVQEIDSGKQRSDRIEWSKFTGLSWSADDKGFFYGAYDAPKQGDEFEQVNKNQKLYYHKLGDPQSRDELVYADAEHPDWQFDGFVSEDGKYLLIDVSVGTDVRTMFYYVPLAGKGSQRRSDAIQLLDDLDATYSFIGNVGSKFYFFTNKDAPKGKVVTIDVAAYEAARKRAATPDKAKPRPLATVDRDISPTLVELIPEDQHTLESVQYTGGKLFAKYMVDAKNEVRVYDLAGKQESTIALPEPIATVYGFGGKADATTTHYGLMSFTRPFTIYSYDIKSGKSELWREPKLAYDPNDFVTEQVFYTSKDGTKVPMYLVHKRGLKPSGDVPTYLYAYGGFNISLTPRFSVPDLVWMEMGGLYAQPNLRGGGEYGESWHEAGTKLQKQNVFDD